MKSKAASARRVSRASEANVASMADLLATIPSQSEASVNERLDQLLRLTVSATCRQLSQETEGECEIVAAVSAHLRAQRETFREKDLTNIHQAIKSGSLLVDSEANFDPEKRKLHAYTERLKEEHTSWKDILKERKENRLAAGRTAKRVAAGQVFMTEEQKHHLTFKVKSSMALPIDLEEVITSAKRHRDNSEVFALAAAAKSQFLRNTLDKENEDLSGVARTLILNADDVGGRISSDGWFHEDESLRTINFNEEDL